MTSSSLLIRLPIYPLSELALAKDYPIADHINLCNFSPKNLGFIPLTDLYKAKHDPQAIKIAFVLEKPSEQEAQILIKNGIQAYTYDGLTEILYAGANHLQVEAYGFLPFLPNGFCFYTAKAGLKNSNSLDLGLIHSTKPAIWAGLFTQNQARASCCDHNIENLSKTINLIAINSGIANACTGLEGKKRDLDFRKILADEFTLDLSSILIASTGKIGIQLDTDKIQKANFKKSDIQDFATSILTTDTRIKVAQRGHLLGIAKGSGMICPNMATMLAFIIGDYQFEDQNLLQEMLSKAADTSFNTISVDGDTSTNDMVLCCLNSSGPKISAENLFEELEQICKDLAYLIIADGEGLTKIIELTLDTALDLDSAKIIARWILNSPLVKTAIHGNDPNWGRIIAALGNAFAQMNRNLNLDDISLKINGHKLFDLGQVCDFDKNSLIKNMQINQKIQIHLNIEASKKFSYKFLANDLSKEYISINAEYST